VIDAGCWVLDAAGYWVLGTGCWVLGAGCWHRLIEEFSHQSPIINHQSTINIRRETAFHVVTLLKYWIFFREIFLKSIPEKY
jgi:hypothetical protein